MELKINAKGQVTIPRELREQYGFKHNVKVKFYAGKGDELRLIKADNEAERMGSILDKMRGYCEADVSTEEVMALTRGIEKQIIDNKK